jgi:hypothetical protein
MEKPKMSHDQPGHSASPDPVSPASRAQPIPPALIEPKRAPLSDRRAAPRLVVDRPCKVLHGPSRRYATARTCNISPTGVLLEVDMARQLMPGEEVDLVIAWKPAGVLASGQMVRARVIRASTGDSGRQVVALEFSDAGQLAIAA